MGILVPISQTPPALVSQIELKEYVEARRELAEMRMVLRMLKRDLSAKLRSGADVEDGLLFAKLYRRRGQRDRLKVGC